MKIVKPFQLKQDYQPPVVELIMVAVERGFADSDIDYGDEGAAGGDLDWKDYGEL